MKNYAEKMTYKEQLEAIEELKEKARWARYRNEICGKSPRENQEIYRLSQKYGDYKKAHEIWIEKRRMNEKENKKTKRKERMRKFIIKYIVPAIVSVIASIVTISLVLK